jgi:outer membrane protein assembly factor BamB
MLIKLYGRDDAPGNRLRFAACSLLSRNAATVTVARTSRLLPRVLLTVAALAMVEAAPADDSNTGSMHHDRRRPVASFASLGDCLGCTGLLSQTRHGMTEFLASTIRVENPLLPGYPEQLGDFWYALRFDPTTRAFHQTYVSERIPGGIAQLHWIEGVTRADDRVAVCGLDGSIRFYSAASKDLLADETLTFPISSRDPTGVNWCAIGDFAHSGERQYLLATENYAAVYDRSGKVLWTFPPPMFHYTDFLVGQMDDDPALEIAVSEWSAPYLPVATPLKIYDGATHAVELQLGSSLPAGAWHLALAHARAGYSPALIVSGWGASVDAFDARSGVHLWQAPASAGGIESLKVAHLDQGDQVLFGDAQFGSVQAVDAATGKSRFSIANPEWGVDQLAVGRDGEGGTEILWGADARSDAAQRFAVADLRTQQVTTSIDLDPFFTAPVMAHLRADRSRQVVFASQSTDEQRGAGAIVVLDADSGKVIANQKVPEDIGGTTDVVQAADVDGDGVEEMVVARTYYYNGAVDVYALTPDRQFVRKSTTWQGPFAPGAYPEFTALAIGNADRRGRPYAVVGFLGGNPPHGSDVSTIVGLDIATAAELWRVSLSRVISAGGIQDGSPVAIEAMGRDESGAELFAVVRSWEFKADDPGAFGGIDIVRAAGTGSSVVASYRGLVSSIAVLPRGPCRLLVGTFDGMALVLGLEGSSLKVISSRRVSSNSVDAIGPDRGGLWIVSGQRAARVEADGSVSWQSNDNGYTAPAGILIDRSREDSPHLWVSSVWRVDGFDAVTADDDDRD